MKIINQNQSQNYTISYFLFNHYHLLKVESMSKSFEIENTKDYRILKKFSLTQKCFVFVSKKNLILC